VRKRLIDFCCKAGGTSMGYHMAGFEVVGADKEPQPNYPFEFYQQDITSLTDKQVSNIGKNFDAIAGSPPCQRYTRSYTAKREQHPDLVDPFREIAEATGLPYVIENVVGAPLIDPVQLCGSAFALRVQRHRLFESNVPIKGIRCNHQWQERHKPYLKIANGPGSERAAGIIEVYGGGDGTHIRGRRQIDITAIAMGIDWMNTGELAQAIPPAYTFYLGRQLMELL
jgi:DNA (cytosine-5)-methyltransferase 1